MRKHTSIEIGKEYLRECDGLYIKVLRVGRSSSVYVCDTYEIDENGDEINHEERLLTASDILR